MHLGIISVKYTIFFLNFLFLILGTAMIVVGDIVQTKIVHYHDFIDYFTASYPTLLTVTGFFVIFIAFLGFFGAIKESTSMIFCYTIIVIFTVAFELGTTEAAYVKRKCALMKIVDKKLNEKLGKYPENPSFNATWHLLQTELKCCGINGPEDWDGVLPENTLPGSCCQKGQGDECSKFDPSVLKDGCKTKFLDYLRSYLVAVVGVGIGAIVVQLLAIVCSCYLYSAYNKDVRH
ncbi:23 kDa integral membrane protein-like [Sitodiplosis mosellana]|uniref:23 kDa integral membrane protein-like n=1 Tax=Sitodiplosis mosellana TaxID=263140 RepID=UPI002444945B|nr:23 kDa integral membrane protein-like [Sitodiplosis mosellana]